MIWTNYEHVIGLRWGTRVEIEFPDYDFSGPVVHGEFMVQPGQIDAIISRNTKRLEKEKKLDIWPSREEREKCMKRLKQFLKYVDSGVISEPFFAVYATTDDVYEKNFPSFHWINFRREELDKYFLCRPK